MSQRSPQENLHEHVESIAEDTKQEITASRRPPSHTRHFGRLLLIIYAIQLSLFAVLAWLVHINPVNPIDISITREFQENPSTERASTRSTRSNVLHSFNRK